MAGPLVYEDGLFELSIDPFENSLHSTFKISIVDPHRNNGDADADPETKSQCGSGSRCGCMPLLNYGDPSNSIRNL